MPRGSGSRSAKQRVAQQVAQVAAPALLGIVALFQIRQAVVHDQSSWSGSGFGMFATIDNEDSRFFRAYAESPAGERQVAVPGRLRDGAFAVQVLPTQDRLDELSRRWLAVVVAQDSGVTGLRVELWRIHFEGDGPVLGAEVLHHAHVSVGGRA